MLLLRDGEIHMDKVSYWGVPLIGARRPCYLPLFLMP